MSPYKPGLTVQSARLEFIPLHLKYTFSWHLKQFYFYIVSNSLGFDSYFIFIILSYP